MARSKRKSPVLDKATLRIAGLKMMAEPIEMGNGLTLSEYEQKVQTLQESLSNYNHLLTTIDQAADTIAEQELDLRQYSEKVLLNAGAKYGKDSVQYMQAGGTIRKTTKRSSPKATTNAIPEAIPTTPLAAAMN
jgi:uncharacterized protein YukE